MNDDEQPESVSRRSFLDRVGRVGGSAAVYRSMSALGLLAASTAKAGPFALEKPTRDEECHEERYLRRGPKVVIVGAGIAGMTAAYELHRAGYHCVVLEGRDKPGGRCETLRRGTVVDEKDRTFTCNFSEAPHLYFNSGPARIPFHHKGLLAYCKTFGVKLETFTNDNRAAYFYDSRALGNKPIRGLEVHTNMRGHISALLSKSLVQGDLDRELNRSDRERLLAMLKEFGDLNSRREFVASSRAGYQSGLNLGHGPSSALEARELSALLDADFWASKFNFPHQSNQTPTLLQPVGGMDRIAAAFAQRTEGMIRTGSKVTGLFNQGQGVRVEYRDKSGENKALEAAFAIVTVAAPLVLEMNSNLSGEHRNALARLRYSRAAKLAFEAPRFWETEYGIFGGISWTNEDITQMWYPASGFQEDSGIIGGAYIWDNGPGLDFARLSEQERIELGKAQGSRIHPEYASVVSRGISRSWYNTDWVRGGWRQGRPNPRLNQPDGRVYFAGEHVNALAGWQEGSIISAQEAVTKIHQRARQSGLWETETTPSPPDARVGGRRPERRRC